MIRLVARLGVTLLFSACFLGCQETTAIQSYESVSGQVSAVNVDSGEIEIKSDAGHPARSGPVRCMWTKDTEAYIHGSFSALSRVAVGDPIRVLGYYDVGLDPPRLVATEIRIDRPLPPPRLPDFLKPRNQEDSTRP